MDGLGGEVLGYSDLMLAKIEYLIHSYLWANSDKGSRGPKPDLDIPTYMKRLNEENQELLTQDDIQSAYAWIYDENFTVPVENYS